jgi:hypothetical protein
MGVSDLGTAGPHVPAGGSGNKYDELLDGTAGQNQQKLDGAKFVAAKRDPDRWAKVLDIAQRTKLPTDVVDRNFDAVQEADTRKRAGSEYDRLISDTPGLAEWLTNPDNATLGREEIASLARVDRGSRIVSTKDEGSFSYGPTIGYHELDAAAGTFAAIYGMGDPTRIATEVAASNKRAAELRAQMPDYAKEFGEALGEHAGDVNRAVHTWLSSQQNNGRTDIEKALDSFKTGAATLGDVLSMVGAAARRPRGLAYTIAEGFPQSVPMLVGGAVGAGVGNVPGLIGGVLIGGMLPSVGAELNAELEKHGVDITDPESLARAYADPVLMAPLREKAARKGVTISMVNALLAPLGGKFLEAAGPGASVVKKVVATAADVGVQAGGVGVGDVAAQRAAGEHVDVGEAIQSTIATLGYAIGQEGVGAGRRGLFHSDRATAAVEAVSQAQEAMRAQRDAQALSEIGTAVSEAKTTQQVPESLKSLVQMATGNDENAQVYFQTKDWDEHFQAKGASPAKAVADIMGDNGQAYYDAKTTGSAIAIPLADYVARVATTEHWGELLNVARTKPDGMSLREASDYLKLLPATMKEIAQEATAPKEATSAEQSAVKVRENVQAQLVEAGVAPSVAKAQAGIYEAAFRTLGERSGQDPLELFNRYQLRITSETPKAPKSTKPAVPLTPEEMASRGDVATKAEGALERAAIANEKPDPYHLPAAERDASSKTDAGEFVYARTDAGSMRSNLSKVSVDGLIDEYARLLEANNQDQNVAVPSVIPDENFHTFNDGRAYVGMKGAAINASGRIKQRQKSIAKLEAALKARGVENAGELLFNRFNSGGTGNSVDFSFDQSAHSNASIHQQAVAAHQAYQEARKVFEEHIAELMAFPDERRKILAAGLRAPPDILNLKQDERGRISFGPHGVEISLLKGADRSTFLHETAHFYLEVLGDLSKADNATALAGDYAKVREWLGAKDGEKLTKDQHEQFARGFETYLMEGKAPSQGLRDAFYRFKRWLVSIYKSAADLGVELTPEVRKVFDRLLAVDSEIARAERDAASRPLFEDPKAIGMSDAQAEAYQRAIAESHQAAEEALTVRMMKQIRREESAEWKAWRDPIEKDVALEINKRPEYRALEFLKNEANPDGTPLADGTPTFKLSREAVKETYGEEAAKALPRGVTAPDGLHPDLVAEVFGYADGRELIDAISKAPKREMLIKQTTDARMQLEHGERLTELQVREAASESVQNDKRAELLRKQAEYLASDHFAQFKGMVKRITRLIPPTDAVREQAAKLVGAKPVRELKPFIYERAAAKLAREAADAFLAGDFQKAFDLNLKELLTSEVFRAATEAKTQIESAFVEFKKFYQSDGKLAKTRDMDLVNAARAILASFGIGRSEKPAFAYLEQLKRYEPDLYDTIAGMVNEATSAAPQGSDYRALSYDDFTALRETVSSLWQLSKRTRQIEIDGIKLDRSDVQLELEARIDEISKPTEKPGYKQAVTKWERTQRNLMSARSWLRRVEHWVDAMDGGKPDGVFRRYIWNPVSEGASDYRLAKRAALEKYLTVVEPIEKAIKAGTIEAQELGYRFEGKAELLGALLHSGNTSNLSKLLRGRGWGSIDETGMLDMSRWRAFIDRMQKEGILTKVDYDYAQGVWDLFEELKPGAQRAHHEMYGHYFAEVTAQEFDTPFGKYRGGYVPAKADPFLVPDAQIHREAESLTAGADNSFMFPTTGRGFTKTRIEAYAKPLIMDVGYIPSHIDAVLRFTHIEPRMKDVGRMIVSHSFRGVLDEFDPTVASDMLMPWLQRAAQQRVDLPGKAPWIDAFWRELRNRTGLQIMTANVLNGLQQFTGASISLAKVEPSHMKNALWSYVRDPKGTAASISEKSEFMRTRMTAGVLEIQKTIDNIMLDPSKYDKARAFAKEHGYFLASGTQHVVDHITWMGAYDQAIAKGVTDRQAVREADSAVRETQGSFAPEDISRVEAQTPFVRAFLQFYGYFNMQANLLGTEFLNTVRSLGLRKGAGRLLFVYVTAMAIPAVLSDAIMRAGSGRPFDDDDDGPADDVFGLLFGSQFRTATRFIPIVGPAIDATIGAFTKSTFDDNIRTSPAVTTVERSVKAPADVYHAIKEKQIRNKDITDVLTAIGMMTGLPVAPVARPINYLRDVSSGKAHPRNVVDFGRGLVTGR